MLVFKVGVNNFCTCEWGQGGGDGVVWGWVCGVVNEVFMEVNECWERCVRWERVGVCLDGWVSEFFQFLDHLTKKWAE